MRRAANRRVLDSLPGGEAWPFLGREMFSRCEQSGAGLYQTQIIHFGASYQAIEYEWSLWVEQFEALLRRLYWASAVVHLETEVNGSHTFRWESERGFHTPRRATCRSAAPGSGRAGGGDQLLLVRPRGVLRDRRLLRFLSLAAAGQERPVGAARPAQPDPVRLAADPRGASYAGRAYAAYGGIYVAASLFWLALSSARGRYGATGWAWPCAWSVPASCCSARACLSDSGGVGGAPVTGAGPRRPGPPHPEPADHCEVLRCTSPFS